jgi:glutathione S-transferase
VTYFTCPTLRLEDGVTHVMDSYQIAPLLEEKYPTPPLAIEPPYLDRFKAIIRKLQVLSPIYVPLVPERVLAAPSLPYFHATRELDTGMPLAQYQELAPAAWEDAQAPLAEMTALLVEKGGPFFLGDTVSYGDFIWAGLLLFFGRFGDDVLERLMASGGDASAHKRLLEAVKPWAERDSY